jgi:hypothetical protein
VVQAGVLWAIVVLVATVTGPIGLAVVLAPVVLMAAGSALRLTKVRPNVRPLVLALAVLVPVASVAGPVTWVGAVVVAAVAILAVVSSSAHPRPARVVVLVAWPAAAAGAVVAAARQDLGVALILIIAACLWDAANFVMGTGDTADIDDTGGVGGAIAGSALVVLLMVAASAVVDASLRGLPIVVLALVLVTLLPAGVALGRRVTGPAVLPGFRRLDSLLVAAPVWVAAVALLLHP